MQSILFVTIFVFAEANTSTAQLQLKTPEIPSNRDQTAQKKGAFGGAGRVLTAIMKDKFLHSIPAWVYSGSLQKAQNVICGF